MKTINKLNTKKATGVDNLPPKILKVATEVISAPLSNIFNKSIKNGQFPDDLKDAQVSPCLKKMTLLSRKIIGLSVFYTPTLKFFESLIHCQLSILKIFSTTT